MIAGPASAGAATGAASTVGSGGGRTLGAAGGRLLLEGSGGGRTLAPMTGGRTLGAGARRLAGGGELGAGAGGTLEIVRALDTGPGGAAGRTLGARGVKVGTGKGGGNARRGAEGTGGGG